MTDDINKVEAGVKTIEADTTGWIKSHTVWAIGLGAFILGAAVEHFLKL